MEDRFIQRIQNDIDEINRTTNFALVLVKEIDGIYSVINMNAITHPEYMQFCVICEPDTPEKVCHFLEITNFG